MVLEEDVFLKGSKFVGEDVEGRSLKGGDGSVALNQVFEADEGMLIGGGVVVVVLIEVVEGSENWRE